MAYRFNRPLLRTWIFVGGLTAVGCSSPGAVGDSPHAEAADPGEHIVFSYPGDLPEWVYVPGVADDGDTRRFAGTSRRFANEVDARKDAVVNAREQIADFLRVDVKRLVRDVSAYVGSSSDIIDPGAVADEATSLVTEVTLLGTRAERYYAEKWESMAGPAPATYWKVYVLVPLPRSAEFDLAIGALQSRADQETEAAKKANIQLAISRLQELKAQNWFQNDK